MEAKDKTKEKRPTLGAPPPAPAGREPKKGPEPERKLWHGYPLRAGSRKA